MQIAGVVVASVKVPATPGLESEWNYMLLVRKPPWVPWLLGCCSCFSEKAGVNGETAAQGGGAGVKLQGLPGVRGARQPAGESPGDGLGLTGQGPGRAAVWLSGRSEA